MAVSNWISKKQVLEITECPICTESFKEPKVLPCIHTFCLLCLEKYGKDKNPEDKANCPLCRAVFSIPFGGFKQLPSNYFILQLMQLNQSSSESVEQIAACDLCSNSTDEPPAVVYCIECEQHLCEPCCGRHKKVKATKGHRVVCMTDKPSAVELMKMAARFCESHAKEEIKFYCCDCSIAVCTVCCLTKHSKHEFADVDELAGKLRADLTNDIECMANYAMQSQQEMKQIEEREKSLKEKVAAAKTQISNKYDQIILLLESQKNRLISELDSFQENNFKELETRKDEAERQCVILEGFNQYLIEIKQKGTSVDISRAANDLHERANELVKSQEEWMSHQLSSIDIEFTPSFASYSNNNWIGQLSFNECTAGSKLSMSTAYGEEDDTPEDWEDFVERKGEKKKRNVFSYTSNRNKSKQASTSPTKEDTKSLQKDGKGEENKQAPESQAAPNNKADATKCAPSTNHSIAKSTDMAKAEEEKEDAYTGQTTEKKRVKNVKPGETSYRIVKILTFLFVKGGIEEKKLALEKDGSLRISAILSIDSVQGKFTEEQIRAAVAVHDNLFQLVSRDGIYFVKDISQPKKPDPREAVAATSKGVQRQDSDNNGSNWKQRSYNDPRESDADVHLSKAMAFMLRHSAKRSHLHIESDGYMYVEEILRSRSLHSYSYTEQDVERVVSNNAKKRFNLIKDEKTGKLKIRANQGHTMEVNDLELTPIINPLDKESTIVHGTYFECVQQIKRKGLSRMTRNHIHFARSEPGSSGVISGMCEDCEVAIYVDMRAAIKDGFEFFRSANDVILCAGDQYGYLPPKYITKILNRHTRQGLSLSIF